MFRRHRPDTSFLAALPAVTSSDDDDDVEVATASKITTFYAHMTRDSRGRMLTEILAFPDNTLEYLHDWVQWLFPLPETSPFNSGAPVIDFATACAFRRSAALRAELRHSFLRMLAFYGFREDREGVVRIDALRWYRQAANWWMSMDHNHLRITRIIRCLRVLGLEKEAEAFFEALRRASGRYGSGPGARSFMFWERAATRPLVLAPEEEEEDPDEDYDEDDMTVVMMDGSQGEEAGEATEEEATTTSEDDDGEERMEKEEATSIKDEADDDTKRAVDAEKAAETDSKGITVAKGDVDQSSPSVPPTENQELSPDAHKQHISDAQHSPTTTTSNDKEQETAGSENNNAADAETKGADEIKKIAGVKRTADAMGDYAEEQEDRADISIKEKVMD